MLMFLSTGCHIPEDNNLYIDRRHALKLDVETETVEINRSSEGGNMVTSRYLMQVTLNIFYAV
jgi:hypothetical protein